MRTLKVLVLITYTVIGFAGNERFYLFALEKNENEGDKQKNTTIIMSVGEHKQLKPGAIKTYSVGNPEIVGHKYWPEKGLLLIKAKRIGHCQLVFWTKDGKELKQEIFIFSKKMELSSFLLQRVFWAMNLSVTELATFMMVEGTINNIYDYWSLSRIYDKYQDQLILKIQMGPQLQNQIIDDINKVLLPLQVKDLTCSPSLPAQPLQIDCKYDMTTFPGEKTLNSLQASYKIRWIPAVNQKQTNNYLLKMKMVQMESADGRDLSFGPSALNLSWIDLFQPSANSLQNWVLKEEIILQDRKIKLSTLAEPQIILRPSVPVSLEMGTNIHFQFQEKHKATRSKDEKNGTTTTTSDASSTSNTSNQEQIFLDWRFAGLKVDVELAIVGDKYELSYQSEFSEPSNQGVSGSKQSSKIFVELQKVIEVFQIGLKSVANQQRSIPLIGEIPLLGNLFSEKTEQNTYKRIYGLFILDKYSLDKYPNMVEESEVRKNVENDKNYKNEDRSVFGVFESTRPLAVKRHRDSMNVNDFRRKKSDL